MPHSSQARQIAESIRAEAKSDGIASRRDLAAIFAHKAT
jgi:hypothetical protein